MARLQRLERWAFPHSFFLIIGVGFLFTFYDIYDINVSWIQTCTHVVSGCTPENASGKITFPILINLAGYVLGTAVFSPLSDRTGRRTMLMATMALTAAGSIWTGFTNGYDSFVAARGLTGIGIGADLALVNTYVGEVAPSRRRAGHTSLILVYAGIGAFVGVWLGLVLTTPAAAFPLGFPWALDPADGWRIMYWIGGGLALTGVLLRTRLPESPRWLVSGGRLDEADAIVRDMEQRAARHGPLPEPQPAATVDVPRRASLPFLDILTSRTYSWRAAYLLVLWAAGYVTVYTFGAASVSVLSGLHYAPSEAGMLTAVGVFGFVVAAVVVWLLGDRMERKYWLPVGAVLTMAGSVIAGEYGSSSVILAFFAVSLIFFGFNVWVPATYAWSAENFPTRARATGFALVDGLGHGGGAVGVLFIVPIVTGGMTALWALVIISSFLCFAAVVAQVGTRTRHRDLEAISP